VGYFAPQTRYRPRIALEDGYAKLRDAVPQTLIVYLIMGIHGLLRELGAGERISLAKLSAQHYTSHSRPLRLAIDISVWLFQIQSGRGGSNPALRTFYYRLLRLLTLNIHPLFVFDGPNKPLFKRNKKVGGPGVRVASVPEFLAKQLLKQIGFPWHVAPGEAEAECALLQREGVVDAVMSEDVDTLMFGAGVWLRNWTAENSTKSPTHVNVYRAEETREKSCGIDRDGMILVALMSGGDYLPEGIPGCGPKVACDAARAGYGRELCALGRKNTAGLKLWKERLQHQIRTNEAKYFSRKNTGFTMPEDFPNAEVFGYYTHPCVSTPEKVQRLKETVRWDLDIDFAALRVFTADAFDWRCRGGAKKFIKNLAPAMLVRELRLRGNRAYASDDIDAEAEAERLLVRAVHGQRNHSTVDGELEYRISFTPISLVSIDLSMEEEDDDFLPAGAGAAEEETDTESEVALPPPSTAQIYPTSPLKKRQFRPYDPDVPEKLWILRPFLQIGCPLLVEEYDASLRDPKELLKQRRKARAAEKCVGDIVHPGDGKRVRNKKGMEKDMPENALMAYARISKPTGNTRGDNCKEPLRESHSQGNSRRRESFVQSVDEPLNKVPGFMLPPTLPPTSIRKGLHSAPRKQTVPEIDTVDLREDREATSRPFAPFSRKTLAKENKLARPSSATQTRPNLKDLQKTPSRRKRRSPELVSPALSQRTITSYHSPSPSKPIAKHFKADDAIQHDIEYIDLVSSTPARPSEVGALSRRGERPQTPTPPNLRFQFFRFLSPNETADSAHDLIDGVSSNVSPLPESVTRRRKRRNGPLRRYRTAPVCGEDGGDDEEILGRNDPPSTNHLPGEELDTEEVAIVQVMDLASPSTVRRGSTKDSWLGEFPDDEEDIAGLPSPKFSLQGFGKHGNRGTREFKTASTKESAGASPPSSYPTPPADDEDEPRPSGPIFLPATKPKLSKSCKASIHSTKPATKALVHETVPNTIQLATRCSPRESESTARQKGKKALILRQSLEGAWKEVDADAVDLSGDGSGYKVSQGRATVLSVSRNGGRAWRKSGVEVLDLTGA